MRTISIVVVGAALLLLLGGGADFANGMEKEESKWRIRLSFFFEK